MSHLSKNRLAPDSNPHTPKSPCSSGKRRITLKEKRMNLAVEEKRYQLLDGQLWFASTTVRYDMSKCTSQTYSIL